MAHYAQVIDDIVQQVLVIEQETIDSGLVGDPSQWIQTSYNTHGGQHRLGGIPLRKNYAGIGYTYDSVRDAFIPPQPYPSWQLDQETCLWNPPKPMPEITKPQQRFVWNEQLQDWEEKIYQ
jgi:hypothetical protein